MTVCMFPGQGSQSRGIGDALFQRFPEITKRADEILGYSIEELCLQDPRSELNNTRFTQPALYVVNALSWRRYSEEHEAEPNLLIGHSLGEYNALEAAGVFTFEQGLKLVRQRGVLMAEAPAGSMAAVIGKTATEIRERLSQHNLTTIDVANFNAADQTIISGPRDDIQRADPLFQGDGARFIPLNTSGAFHSRYMEPAGRAFEQFLDDFSFSEPRIPVIANVDALPYSGERAKSLLTKQIFHSVRWLDCVKYCLEKGEQGFTELGPGRVLSRLVDTIKSTFTPTQPDMAVASSNQTGSPATGIDRKKELANLQQKILQWNQDHPVGSEVLVMGYQGPLVTRTPAMTLFGHRAAVYLEGYNGYFELSDLKPVSSHD